MIDELLGRASLKERIAELEADLADLESRYEAESKRRADAVTAKQTAEERRNRLEDRIAQLEGELERTEESGSDRTERRRKRLRGERLREVLTRIESVRTGPEGAFTAAVSNRAAVRSLPEAVEDVLGDRIARIESATPCIVCVDDAGLLTFTLSPPIQPTIEATWSDRFELERRWFVPTGQYALALVRADLFALGVYDDGERVRYRGFESDVKGSHSKGGFSQARFERIRDAQIDDHLSKVSEAIADTAGDVERLYLVGQRGVVQTVGRETTPEPSAIATVDATGSPKAALADAHRSFWTTKLELL